MFSAAAHAAASIVTPVVIVYGMRSTEVSRRSCSSRLSTRNARWKQKVPTQSLATARAGLMMIVITPVST